MKSFKFFANPLFLVHSHDGHPILAGELFHSVAKYEYWGTLPNGKRRKTEKYSIAMRWVSKLDKDRFRPDHERLWYFKSKSNAEWLIEHWKRQDRIIEMGNNI